MSTLYLVSTPIGNLGDLSARAGDTLRGVSRILAEDTRRTRVLADHVGADAPLTSLHAHNEAERTEKILQWLAAGEDLALVSDAGTPLVSDPGGRVVSAVAEAGHEVVPIPGPSAALAALVASGLPTDRFTFLGFLDRKGKGRTEALTRIARSSETTVLFESPKRLGRLLQDLGDFCGPAREVCVARELTKLHEEIRRGTLGDLVSYYVQTVVRGEVTVVVGPSREDGSEAVSDEEAASLARELLGEGLTASRAAQELSARLGLARNRAYRIVHDVQAPS